MVEVYLNTFKKNELVSLVLRRAASEDFDGIFWKKYKVSVWELLQRRILIACTNIYIINAL